MIKLIVYYSWELNGGVMSYGESCLLETDLLSGKKTKGLNKII